MKILGAVLSLFFLFGSASADGEVTPLEINIVSKMNGFGLTTDYEILREELSKFPCVVKHVNILHRKDASPADINIFLELVDSHFFDFAKVNYFIPNPEWCNCSKDDLKKFDLILCKTIDAIEAFKPYSDKLYYLGFTSQDKYDPSVPKDYRKFLHFVGGSRQKGTSALLAIWRKRPDFPVLNLIAHYKIKTAGIHNLQFYKGYLKQEELNLLLNECGVHLCPSTMEGFGHYISEAMSAAAALLTTDAPPMNELMQDSRFLIPYVKTEKHYLGTAYSIDQSVMAAKISWLLLLSDEALAEIGEANRAAFLKRREQFRENLRVLFGPDGICR